MSIITPEQVAEMQARLEAKRKESKANLDIKTQVALISAEMKLLDNPALETARVTAEVAKVTTNKLEELIIQCTIIVAQTPDYNERKRENRKFTPSRFFGLGDQIDKVYGLLTGIQYSSAVHKDELLATTGLDSQLIETAIEAFGRPASYWNGVLRPEIPTTAKALSEALLLVSEKLGITYNCDIITEARLNSLFINENARAHKELSEYLLTKELENQTLDLDADEAIDLN